MATKINIQPPDLNNCKSYEAFKREISAWADVTDLSKQKQGNFIVLSLPNFLTFNNISPMYIFKKKIVKNLLSNLSLFVIVVFEHGS